ncbi:Vps23 core domain-containing protein [Mycena leptocephala]|nr:Vps23 core domain-containing protein [Mycena leptocephala]
MDQRTLTQKWLRENVVSYAAAERVFADIDAALTRFPSLRPKSDVYTYDDGRTQLLLCIHGLLPISFRGASYNIPIALWLTRDYPLPTTDMLVKPGPHLDVSGRSSIDYVLQWARKSEGCSLSGLIDAMQAEFSRVPPVYAKPRDGPQATPQASQASPHQPSQPPPQQPTRPQPPVLPPKPQTPQTPQISQNASHVPHYNPQYVPQVVQSPGYASPTPTNAGTARPPPPLPPHPRIDPVPAPAPAPAPAPNFIDEDTPEPILYAPQAVPAAPAPPRPPNPELLRLHAAVHAKLSSELASLGHALAVDAERLRTHQADLLAGEPAIRDEMARLEAVRDVCRTAAGRMRGAVETAERNVADLRAKSTPEVDELVCSTTIVHNQLINLVAEDNAIEDTIFHLSKALNSGRIDLERFLRSCRLLAEEQFMKRALIEKIETGIPMGQPGY